MKSVIIISLLVFLMAFICKSEQSSIDIPGDVKLVGLFEIHEPDSDSCGSEVKVTSVMTAEAVKWYLQQLNRYDQLPLIIGYEAFETCRLVDQAAEVAVKVMNRVLSNDTIVGMVGPEFSSEAEVISPILSSVPEHKRLIQVGFSTTATRLGDQEQYPNFVRVVPNDDVQVEMMIQSMVQLHWNRIAILYEDDLYGRDASARLSFRAKQESICVSMIRGIAVYNGITASEVSNLLNEIVVGTGSRPSIHGIVYIGDTSVSRTIFLTLSSFDFSSAPIVMLSEGINMNTNVFKQYSGEVISVAKGSLVFAPPYREVSEFSVHWKTIFTNASYFQEESESNPWLFDVFYAVTNCEKRDCKFSAFTDAEYNAVFETQPMYVYYAILAAHALVKVTTQLQETSCSICDIDVSSGDVLKAIKGLEINLATDFSWRLESLSGDSPQLTFGSSGEVMLPVNVPVYELFNYRKPHPLSNVFELMKIGEYINKELHINTSRIKDYTSQGETREWPDVRKVDCREHTKCEECFHIEELYERIIYEAGDIYVVGVVPVFDKSGIDGCGSIRTISGYQSAESIRFAVEKVNEKTGDFANLFPGAKIGVILLNSCNNPVVIQRKIYDLHKHGIILEDGTVVDLSNKIMGYVGDMVSDVSISVSEVLSRLEFVQISYASTSPSLSDRNIYPYFMRVVTPDDAQALAMIGIIKELDADCVQIVHSVGAYGDGGRDRIKEAADRNKVCVIQEIPLNEDDSPYQVYYKLVKFPNVKVVIIFLQTYFIVPVMTALVSQMSRGEFIFIRSEARDHHTDVLEFNSKEALLGSFTVSLEMYQDNELRSRIQSLAPQPYSNNPWSMIYLQAKGNCYFDFSFDKTQYEACMSDNDNRIDPNFDLDAWDTSAYIAAKCLLIGASSFLRDTCGAATTVLCSNFTSNTAGLVGQIRKTKLDLDGSGDRIKVFNDNGDGNIGYRIYNVQKDPDDHQQLIYVEVGRYPLEGTFTFEKDKIVYPTETKIVSTCPNQQACSGGYEEPDQATQIGGETSLTIEIVVLGFLLAVAVIVVVVLVQVVVRHRRKQTDANELYLTPIASEGTDYNRSDDIGSDGFSDIPICGNQIAQIGASEPPDAIENEVVWEIPTRAPEMQTNESCYF